MEEVKKIKEKRILTPIISVVLTIVISCFITFLFRTTTNIIGLGNSSNITSSNNSDNSTNYRNSNNNTNYSFGNRIEIDENVQNDSIKRLIETLVEKQKELNKKQEELDMLILQQKNQQQRIAGVRSISNVMPDTTRKKTTDTLESIVKPTGKDTIDKE